MRCVWKCMQSLVVEIRSVVGCKNIRVDMNWIHTQEMPRGGFLQKKDLDDFVCVAFSPFTGRSNRPPCVSLLLGECLSILDRTVALSFSTRCMYMYVRFPGSFLPSFVFSLLPLS